MIDFGGTMLMGAFAGSILARLHPLPEVTQPLPEFPVEQIVEKGGLYFRSILLKYAGTLIPQHEHDHDHVTLIGSGKARSWQDGEWIGDFGPGEVVEMKAGRSHAFQALEPNTHLTCVHSVESALSIKEKGL